MPTAVARIQRTMGSRRLLASPWPSPMTAPVANPPIRAANGLSTRPATRPPMTPEIGKDRKPTVHSSQGRRKPTVRTGVETAVLIGAPRRPARPSTAGPADGRRTRSRTPKTMSQTLHST